MGSDSHCRDLEKPWGQSREGPHLPKAPHLGLSTERWRENHHVGGQRFSLGYSFLSEIHWGLFSSSSIVDNKALGAVEGNKNSCAYSYSQGN